MTSTCSISDLRPGDAIAFGPADRWIGPAISFATFPPWPFEIRVCHFGIVVPALSDSIDVIPGEYWLCESTADKGLGPCKYIDKGVMGVQSHDLHERMELHLRSRKAIAWRLPLTPESREKLTKRDGRFGEGSHLSNVAEDLVATGYDFAGAWGSRGKRDLLWKIWHCFHDAPPAADAAFFLFCSELVLLIYKEFGILPPSIMPSHYHPKAAKRLLVDTLGVCGPMQEIRLCE